MMKPMVTRRTILRSALGATVAVPPLHALATSQGTKESTAAMWDRIVRPFLADDQWTDMYAYDAGHALMIPLQATFGSSADDAWRGDFADHLARFVSYAETGSLPENLITRQQYLYLWSQFAVLAHMGGYADLVPSGLKPLLAGEQQRLWAEEPAWQWGRDPFASMRERLQWKLDHEEVELSYYRAIVDEELFNIAIAADLVALSTLTGEEPTETALEAVGFGDRIFRQEGQLEPSGGWLFQPGTWEDHPDYAYAGHETITEDMEEDPVPGIAGDTSHSHRMACWMRSLQAVPGDEERETLYRDILTGLDRQFFDEVLFPPSDDFTGYRTTNYMDGHNGVFRWEYETQGEGNGYGPWELSGTLCHGWWIFLGSDNATEMYRGMATTFPLADNVLETYVGPNTTRERHPMMTLPDYHTNGFSELIARLAGDLSFI